MSFNYCPNCGHALYHTALTSNPPIPVVKCGRCGWEMRDGRAPSWDTVPDSTDGTRINWQAQESVTIVTPEYDTTIRVPPEHKMLRGEFTCIIDPDCHKHDCPRDSCPHKGGE